MLKIIKALLEKVINDIDCGNSNITEDEARLYFEDMDNIDDAFTEAGKKKFGSIIPDMDYLKNASQTK